MGWSSSDLVHMRADDDVVLLVGFSQSGAADDQVNPVFEAAGEPNAIGWYTNRALGLPVALPMCPF